MHRSSPIAAALITVLALAPPTFAGGPLTGFHAEPMDGANSFPAGTHLSENPHSSPFGGCGAPGGPSDAAFESSAYHLFRASGAFVDEPLPPGGCMDVRETWLSWDTAFLYLGVKGPNELYERGDLLIALDVLPGGGVSSQFSPWLKAVDFCGWSPDFFLAIEAPKSAGGYAALLNSSHFAVLESNSGTSPLLWEDGGYRSCDDGGMYYEFKVPLAVLGLASGVPQELRFAAYTTGEDNGFDAYDSGPGCGQTIVHEQIGDYPYDGDHCSGATDCFTGVGDAGCGIPDSDNGLGAGNAIGGRFPSSDDSGFDRDTIREYWMVTNFNEPPATPALPRSWGRIKSLYR
jgi:hypothetical protein